MRRLLLLLTICLASCAKQDPRQAVLGAMPDVHRPAFETQCEVVPWTCLGYEGVCLRTPRWDICTTIMIPSLHQRLPEAMEASLEHMRRTLDGNGLVLPEPSRPMTTCLMSDRRQWSNVAKMLHPAHAEAMQGLTRGGFAADGVAILYDIDQRDHCRDTIALAMHEGWHQYVQLALPGTLPGWLDEGVATLMEGYRLQVDGIEIDHAANRQRARRAWWLLRRDRLPPLQEFIDDDPHDAMDRGRSALLNYYAHAWAFMRFMLVDDARRAIIQECLIEAVNGRHGEIEFDVAALEPEFHAWVDETLRPSWWR